MNLSLNHIVRASYFAVVLPQTIVKCSNDNISRSRIVSLCSSIDRRTSRYTRILILVFNIVFSYYNSINFFKENTLACLHNLPVLHLQDEEDCSCSSRVCNCRLILSTTHFLWFFNSVCHWNVQPRSPSFSRPHFTAAQYDILLCCHWKFHEQGIHACQWNIHIINQEEPGSSMDSFCHRLTLTALPGPLVALGWNRDCLKFVLPRSEIMGRILSTKVCA